VTDDEVEEHVTDSQVILHQQHSVMLLDKRLHGHVHLMKTLQRTLLTVHRTILRYGDGAGNTVEENSSVFSLIQMR